MSNDPLWPVDGLYPDMQPPATSRDRWMFDQGRLAERRMAQPVAVPQGWTLVPMKPTEAMGIAGGVALESSSAHDVIGPLEDAWVAMLAAAPAAPASEHPDDEAVERFASMLKAKLAKAREKGRRGWADPSWPATEINRQLHEHAAKGDPLDVAAYAMFLALRGEASAGAPSDLVGAGTFVRNAAGEWVEVPRYVRGSCVLYHAPGWPAVGG